MFQRALSVGGGGGNIELSETVTFFVGTGNAYNLRYYNVQDNSYKIANGGGNYSGSASIIGDNIEINYPGGHSMNIKSKNGYHLFNLSTMSDFGTNYTWSSTAAYASGYQNVVFAAIKDAPTDAS